MSELQVQTPASQGSLPIRRPRDPWVRFACPHCGKRNKADSMSAGRKASCARCGQLMKVPSPASSASPAPSLPVMRTVDPLLSPVDPPAVVESAPNWLRTLSDHVAERDEASRAEKAKQAIAPRQPFRLPTWVMVVLHASLTLGTIAAIWIFHAHGYFAGFDAARR